LTGGDRAPGKKVVIGGLEPLKSITNGFNRREQVGGGMKEGDLGSTWDIGTAEGKPLQKRETLKEEGGERRGSRDDAPAYETGPIDAEGGGKSQKSKKKAPTIESRRGGPQISSICREPVSKGERAHGHRLKGKQGRC